jgi:hypothetical protein
VHATEDMGPLQPAPALTLLAFRFRSGSLEPATASRRAVSFRSPLKGNWMALLFLFLVPSVSITKQTRSYENSPFCREPIDFASFTAIFLKLTLLS